MEILTTQGDFNLYLPELDGKLFPEQIQRLAQSVGLIENVSYLDGRGPLIIKLAENFERRFVEMGKGFYQLTATLKHTDKSSKISFDYKTINSNGEDSRKMTIYSPTSLIYVEGRRKYIPAWFIHKSLKEKGKDKPADNPVWPPKMKSAWIEIHMSQPYKYGNMPVQINL